METTPAPLFLDALADLLGPKGLTTDGGDMAPWLTDWRGRYRGKALALAQPSTTSEVAALVTLCARHRVSIVPQGGNSGMVGGATPDGSGTALLLSLRRMKRVRNVDEDSGQITVEAGVVLQTLHDTVAAKGWRFPLTLGGKGSATVGGLVSTNAGGTQVLRHGTMRAQVLGLEAVLPDGSVLDGLAPLPKDNRGYDLKHLLIGAEGTLGIVTAATLKLVPALIDRAVVWAGVDSPQAARALLLALDRQAGSALEGFEILPESCLDHVLGHIPGTRRPLNGAHRWHVLIELVRDRPEAQAPYALAERLLAEALTSGLIEDATIAASEAQADAFWKLRDSISEAERAQGPAMQHDIAVPPPRMPDFITETAPQVEARFPGTRVAAFGHLGDGNVHYHVIAPAGAQPGWQEGDGKAVSALVHDLVTAWGGSISAEHGIGQMKAAELARLGDPARMAALIAIKHALDPLGLMNPGKLLPR